MASKHIYDLDSIENKTKQYAVYLIVLIILFVSLIMIKKIYIKSMSKPYTTEINTEELGSISEEKEEEVKTLNKKYPTGNLIGNSQINIEQGNTSISSLANSKSQLAFYNNIVFRSKLVNGEYKLTIENEKDGVEIFENKSPFKNKCLIALEDYYVFVRVTDKGDRLMSVNKKLISIDDITPNRLISKNKITSVVTDGNNLFITDGDSLYKTGLYGESAKVITTTSPGARIVNLYNGFIFLDDGYNLYKVDIKNNRQDILIKHDLSPVICWDRDSVYMLNIDGQKNIKKIIGKESGSILKNSDNIDAFTLINNNYYASVGKKLYSLDDGELLLTTENSIVNIYSSNNYLYVYDITGEEYKLNI